MNPDIPSTFPSVKDPELKRDLERFAGGVIGIQKQSARDFSPNFEASRPLAADGAASFGQVTRIGALEDTDRFIVQLPRPNPANAGKQLGVQRSGSLGCVYLTVPGALVNGRARLMLLGSKLLTTVTFDGENYYADNDGSSPWGGL
jgi:hypothetical protein